MKTVKTIKAEVIKNFLTNPSFAHLTPKDIAKRTKVTRDYVYQLRAELRKNNVMPLRKKVIPTIATAKAGAMVTKRPLGRPRKSLIENKIANVNTPTVNKADITTLKVIAFNSELNLNYNLGSAVSLIASANTEQDKIANIRLAMRHLAYEVAHLTNK